ncbi:SAM-dependent methyltransferase, partial [Candidatus Bathyarchaeota archaeon]|nr:SAM-dependent methyltransferase [Candidatus Bathyarchaeota archaeon]
NVHVKARRLILENCDLQAVISMPSGVFQPYAGVATAVLLFVKGGKTEKVWFCEIKSDGYSLDQKRDFIDGKGDIPDIVAKFKGGRLESSCSMLVPLETIEKNDYNLSISRYKKEVREEIEYDDPQVLIDGVLAIEDEITGSLRKLKDMIG